MRARLVSASLGCRLGPQVFQSLLACFGRRDLKPRRLLGGNRWTVSRFKQALKVFDIFKTRGLFFCQSFSHARFMSCLSDGVHDGFFSSTRFSLFSQGVHVLIHGNFGQSPFTPFAQLRIRSRATAARESYNDGGQNEIRSNHDNSNLTDDTSGTVVARGGLEQVTQWAPLRGSKLRLGKSPSIQNNWRPVPWRRIALSSNPSLNLELTQPQS